MAVSLEHCRNCQQWLLLMREPKPSCGSVGRSLPTCEQVLVSAHLAFEDHWMPWIQGCTRRASELILASLEIKLPTSIGSLKKQESSRKTPASALLIMPKPLTVWITTNCGKFLKRWEYQTPWPASWEICIQVKKQQLELDMEQQTGSKLGKEYVKAVYCHPAYLNYMQSTAYEMLGWMKHKLESRLLGELSIT